MKPTGTHIKALLLLLSFAMNSVIGTACSFSSLFHQLHHHRTGTEHRHTGGQVHSHEHAGAHHTEKKHQAEDCCATLSVAFNRIDKSLTRGMDLYFPVLELPGQAMDLPYRKYNGDYTFNALEQPRRWRPPGTIQEIRIVIHSFRI